MFFDNSGLSSGQLPPKKKDEKNKIQKKKTLKRVGRAGGDGGEGPKW